MRHVFISYVRQNSDVIDRLAKDLRSRGVDVWLDREAIEPGLKLARRHKKRNKKGTFFVACFSREYNARDDTYMNEELTIAIRRIAEKVDGYSMVYTNNTQ